MGKEQEEERQLAALRKTPLPPLSCRRFVVVVVFVVPVPLVSLSLSPSLVFPHFNLGKRN